MRILSLFDIQIKEVEDQGASPWIIFVGNVWRRTLYITVGIEPIHTEVMVSRKNKREEVAVTSRKGS